MSRCKDVPTIGTHTQLVSVSLGSEFAVDAIGQEGLFLLLSHYKYTAESAPMIETLLGIDALVPHWKYSGTNR